jgi:P27 family predicted phage terminase small subunit
MQSPNLKHFKPKTVPKPPKHLRAATRRWWASVVEAYELESHHLRLLTLAAESWDRAEAAREAIQQNGSMFFTTKSGEPRRHPAVQVEHDAKIAFARLLRELALDVSVPGESRPPMLGRGR